LQKRCTVSFADLYQSSEMINFTINFYNFWSASFFEAAKFGSSLTSNHGKQIDENTVALTETEKSFK
jgi:hypothetical protein